MEPESPKPQDKDQEFRSYRRALTIVYVGALGLGSGLLVVSIVFELFLHGHRHQTAWPRPAELLQCNREVRGLLEDMGRTAAALQAELVIGDGRDIEARWEDFARRDWQGRWEAVLRRCEFDELAETGLGPAFDRMAAVHRELPAMMLKYRELMERFTKDQARELDAMRRALDKSEKLLEERAGTPPAKR